jgi:hypothetical protein
MQYQFFVIILVIFLIGISVGYFILPDPITKTEFPSFFDKNEWASLVIKNNITMTTDLWEARYGVGVSVFDETKTIAVIITTANGEKSINNTDFFRNFFEQQTESSIERFDWLKDYQVILTMQ